LSTVVASPSVPAKPARRRYVPAVGPRLKKLLAVVFALFAILCVNSIYLSSITLLGWWKGVSHENQFYQLMFLLHLVLGLAIILPVVIFGLIHMRNSINRPNRRAIAAGFALFGAALLTLVTGLLLTRVEIGPWTLDLRDSLGRDTIYWLHIIAPIAAIWLFILHRLAGRRIKWRTGLAWGGVALVAAAAGLVMHGQDPRQWNVAGPADGERYFFPSLARTATGNFIPAEALMMNHYCMTCHEDVHSSWAQSAHAFSSFNNPPYAFSVRETRAAMFERDGNVHGARWCAGCHDPVPFFSGAFEDPRFDDPHYDVSTDPMGSASLSCVSCHAITHVNSNRGNADYTIEEPLHYPFAFSENRFLQWINAQLIKAKPEFHKQTFLKPLHRSAEFCSTCHKVHLPEELNAYRWLRGQNSFDSFHLSGVSGHGITSWYYPAKAETDCNNCHMPYMPSNDFGSKIVDDTGVRKIRDHMFPSANTAIPWLVDMPCKDEVIAKHIAFNEGVTRMDIFGLREGGSIDGPLLGPIRPELPVLRPGESYLIEAVIRTVKMGHELTQGTADSNELWIDATVTSGDTVIGRIGGMDEYGFVDPWSPFMNVYMLDRDGNRIDRRNPQDIFVPLYNRQIPPGAGDVTHLGFRVPEGTVDPIHIDIKLQYRKFDTIYMRHVFGPDYVNDLPIMTLAHDSVTLPVQGGRSITAYGQVSDIPEWQRWNDYGIGLFRKAGGGSHRGQLRQADEAFARVEELGRADGALNRARVAIEEGRLDDAVELLGRAAAHPEPANPWSIAYFTAVVNRQNGYLDEAIGGFRTVIASQFPDAVARGFDFSKDYRLLLDLGQTLYERARQERGDAQRDTRKVMLREAASWMRQALSIDSEFAAAHYALAQVLDDLGEPELSDIHRALHDRYRVDDNARDRAIAIARRADPAANHAADPIVIFDLQRAGAFGLPAAAQAATGDDAAVGGADDETVETSARDGQDTDENGDRDGRAGRQVSLRDYSTVHDGAAHD